MGIRWYKNGKLNRFQDFSKSELSDSSDKGIEVGSHVRVPINTLRYIRPNDYSVGGEDFDKNLWIPTTKPEEINIVSKKIYIESPYYTGYIVKLYDRWPWYQITELELVEK